MSLVWKITDEYFEHNGLTYKRVTTSRYSDATWYRVDDGLETIVVPGEFESMYQEMKKSDNFSMKIRIQPGKMKRWSPHVIVEDRELNE